MAGNGTNADDEPAFVDQDEEGSESTIAMASPAFDSSGIPLPISEPPPAMPNAGGPVRGPMTPPTAPLAFAPTGLAPISVPKPGASSSTGTPRTGPRIPASSKAPVPKSQIGAPRPGAAAAAPSFAKKARQTVIGIAPPAAGAQRPPGAAPPASGIDAPRPAASPVRGVSASAGMKAPAVPAPRPAAGTPPPTKADETPENDERDDGPTIAGSVEGLIGLDEAVAAAQAASLGPPLGSPLATPKHPATSPLASTAYRPTTGNEPETVTVSKDTLERARRLAQDELSLGQGAQLIIGADAVGDEATLAVAPGDNEANAKHRAALAATMIDGGGFPPPPGSAPRLEGPQIMGPPKWPDPSHAWPPNAPVAGVGLPAPVPSPYAPMSNPHGMAVGGKQMGGQIPLAMPHPGVPGPAYPTQRVHEQARAPAKISKQIILLTIVGVICVAIFITGVVLFATTKF